MAIAKKWGRRRRKNWGNGGRRGGRRIENQEEDGKFWTFFLGGLMAFQEEDGHEAAGEFRAGAWGFKKKTGEAAKKNFNKKKEAKNIKKTPFFAFF